jgi:hypothetical protein
MLQRIQTLFLVIALGAIAACFLLPLWLYSTADGASSFEVYVYGLKAVKGGLGDMFINTQPLGVWPLAVILAANAGLTIGGIFFYKNRPIQMKLTNYNFFLSLIFIAAAYLYIPYNINERVVTSVTTWQYGLILPLITTLALIIANRYIKKDENLVKSADRLR